LNEHEEDFRDKIIKHNLRVRGLNPNSLTVKDYHNIKSKKVTCDMCKELYFYKQLRRVNTIGMICNNCYFK